MREEPKWKQPIPTLDLRKFCRDSDTIETTVSIMWDWDRMHQFVWLKLGQISLNKRSTQDDNGLWVLDSYLGGHTDFEHDSAHILRLELIGVSLHTLAVGYGRTRLNAWINPNLDTNDGFDTFGVPTEGYNPLDGADACDQCKGQHDEAEPHLIVEEGNYVPPNNQQLYELVRGKRVEICTGPITK